MSAKLSYLKSAKSFADEMDKKYTSLIKEWQVNAISRLNDYCRGNITAVEFLKFISAYNKVLIQQEYWIAQSSFLQYEINCEVCNHGFKK